MTVCACGCTYACVCSACANVWACAYARVWWWWGEGPALEQATDRCPCTCLPARRCIKHLDISWNTLGRRGGQALGAGLREANTICELHAAWTGITDVGASHIARVGRGWLGGGVLAWRHTAGVHCSAVQYSACACAAVRLA